MKKVIFSCLVVAFVMTSCATVQSYSYSEYRTVEPTQQVATIPVVADLQVDSVRITYAERVNVNITSMTSIEVEALVKSQKETVLFNAIKQYNADIIVAPLIDVQSEPSGSLVITVVGYPATYTHFRNATKEDEVFLMKENPDKVQPEIHNQKKSLFFRP